MKLTFLGTASGVPVLHWNHSALLIEKNGISVLLDAGEGVSRALLERNIHPDTIEKIFISHTHADHVGGVPMLLQMMYLNGRTKPISIYCSEDKVDWLVRMLHGLLIFKEKWSFSFEVLPLPFSGDATLKDIDIRFFPNNHLANSRLLSTSHGYGASAYSFIVREGNTNIVVSSDIESINDIRDVSSDATHLIVECTHLSLETIFNFVEEHKQLKVFITHIPPEIESVIEIWKVKFERELQSRVTFAYDGLTIDTNL